MTKGMVYYPFRVGGTGRGRGYVLKNCSWQVEWLADGHLRRHPLSAAETTTFASTVGGPLLGASQNGRVQHYSYLEGVVDFILPPQSPTSGNWQKVKQWNKASEPSLDVAWPVLPIGAGRGRIAYPPGAHVLHYLPTCLPMVWTCLQWQ